ncbi:MAG: cell division protein ZipA [Porticoccaceae bacterium]
MEFGTREILIVLGIVIILGILLDGLRRVRQSRNGTLKVSRRKQSIFDDAEDIGGELPGKVRVIRRDKESADQVSDNIRRSRENNADKCTSAFRQRSSSGASDFFSRPTTPPAEGREPEIEIEEPAQWQDEQWGDEEPHVTDNPPQEAEHDYREDERGYPEHERGYPEGERDARNVADERETFTAQEEEPAQEKSWVVSRDDEPVTAQPFHLEPPQETPAVAEAPRAKRKPFWEERAPEPPPPAAPASVRETRSRGDDDAVDVIVLHVMAKKDGRFEGEALLDALLGNGLRYGDMGIFHRHQEENGSGPVHFSLANSVKPGTFDLASMDSFSTPGVTLFMPLDGLSNPLECYAQLIKIAQALAKTLGGELKDETRSALTKQTIEHYRQQIIEFTRRSFTLSH